MKLLGTDRIDVVDDYHGPDPENLDELVKYWIKLWKQGQERNCGGLSRVENWELFFPE